MSRFIIPILGLALSLCSYLFFYYYKVIDLDSASLFISNGGEAYILLAFFVLVLIESTVAICHYIPGTVALLILASLPQVQNISLLKLITSAFSGYLVGLTISNYAGVVLGESIKRYMGNAIFSKFQNIVERYGIYSLFLTGFHPNNASSISAIYGVAKGKIDPLVLIVAVAAQLSYAFIAIVLYYWVGFKPDISNGQPQLWLSSFFILWIAFEAIRLWRRHS